MELKAGMQLRSTVGPAEVVVIRAPDQPATLTSGGLPMVARDDEVTQGDVQPGGEGAVLLGKRYVDEAGSIEVLCTKPGDGVLAVDGRPLDVKSAKPLPSSD